MKGRSTTTAILEIERIMFNNNKGHSALIFVDLKGAFETVSHHAIKSLIQCFDVNLSTLITSYLTNRKAFVTDNDYPNEFEALKYLPGRSTPQGSKLSPSLFSYNSGLIVKWFLDLYNSSNSKETYCNVILYADDAAIYISCSSINKLKKKIPLIIDAFSRIANIYGAALEMTKTEILMSKQTQSLIKSVTIQETTISTDVDIKWLGYQISLTKCNTININIPTGKICAIKNSVRIFQLHNRNITDNRKFYNIYIRPIFDLWLVDTKLVKSITKYESQVLKIIGSITSSASISDTYKHLGINTVQNRSIKFAQNLIDKGILNQTDLNTTERVLKSGRIRIMEPIRTLSDRLISTCVQYTQMEIIPEFNKETFCKWRKMVKKVASNKAKYNSKPRQRNYSV